MQRKSLSIPEIGLIAGTRTLLGVGLGFLIADYLKKEPRRAVGWTLLGVGVLSTVPIAVELFSRRPEQAPRRTIESEDGRHSYMRSARD